MIVVITGASREKSLGWWIHTKMKQGSPIGMEPVSYRDIYSFSLEQGVDVRDVNSIARAAIHLPRKIDVLINCAGVNGIDYLPNLSEETWDRVMDTNAKGIYLVSKALLEPLRGGTILNIVSNASHVPMTCSLAYNASKGAAEIMTKQMSRELIKTHNITVFGISPNRLQGTGMSKEIDDRVCQLRGWTPLQARNYQLTSLPAGEETDPETLAEFIAFLLSSKKRHKYLRDASWIMGCEMAEKLGDGPIEAAYIAQMNAMAAAIDIIFNGEELKDRKTGFVLLVFPFQDHEGRCNFISNGADRKDLVVLFKEMIARFEGQPELKGNG